MTKRLQESTSRDELEANLNDGAQDLTSQDLVEVNLNSGAQDLVPEKTVEALMNSRIQELASKINMSCDEFVGEMRKRGCSEPTALKIWRGGYEDYNEFEDNDVLLSNLRKAADVLKVGTAMLLPR